jgi:hypothetical protein
MTDHKPCDPADPCATAYDLASERNTLDGLWAETKDRLDAALAETADTQAPQPADDGCCCGAAFEASCDKIRVQGHGMNQQAHRRGAP